LVNEYRRTWAQILGGLVLGFGLYFTWRRIEISQQELEATRDQQVTERFTRAIDQLGATDDKGRKKLEIRLGGIYALERIAVDSFAMVGLPRKGLQHGHGSPYSLRSGEHYSSSWALRRVL
jgi:HAMP domain-containing protein